jgi:hypothetical protein
VGVEYRGTSCEGCWGVGRWCCVCVVESEGDVCIFKASVGSSYINHV